jgi:hypothetical protein
VVPPFRPVPRVVEQLDASPSSRVPGGDAGDSGLALDELDVILGSEGCIKASRHQRGRELRWRGPRG